MHGLQERFTKQTLDFWHSHLNNANCNSISSTLSFPAFLCIHLMEERHSFHDNGVICHMRLLWWWAVFNPPPDDCSPLRSISLKWSRCENWPVKGLLHQQIVLNSWWIPRAICRRRGNVPDCDLLMVWRLFAWICLMADFSRAEPSAGAVVEGIWVRGHAHLQPHSAAQPHFNPSPPSPSHLPLF